MQRFATRIRTAIASATGIDAAELRLERPRDASLGDFAFPCFVLAKQLKAAPPAIAADLADKLNAELGSDPSDRIEAIATGPYLNFKVDGARLAEAVLFGATTAGADYGRTDEGGGKNIVIDMSSPNIAKPMHVGHLRSTILGAALYRMHELLGYRPVSINHIGDWGSQFGKLVAAIDRWGGEYDIQADPIPALLALYVRFHDEAEAEPALEEEARAAFRELESGVDGQVRATWRQLTELSLAEFNKTYERLGVEFDLVRGEAWYEDKLQSTLERIEATGVTEESDGARIVDLTSIRKKMAPCLLKKTDGTTLYATRDMAALFSRWDEFAFERCLYVVGSDQKLHFEQLKGVLKRMQLDWEPRVEHVAFGMMRLPGGKLSTRAGKVVFLSDVLDRAVEEAAAVIADKNPDLAASDHGAEIAEQVGVGAIVFNDLKRERIKDVVFQWDEVLSFEGETGPYVQYSHARLCSILRKAEASGEAPGQSGAAPDWSAVDDARGLILTLGRYPDTIRTAAADAEPSHLTQYLLGLCREVNSWYANSRVLGEAPGTTAARLALVDAARVVVRNGLAMLGVAAPTEM
ncbi:MAG: arginine--tRNA ligase [Planctomycetota bacterium]|nr:arginine--tRNA ligase [Planctomycetota bacterium]